jgi:serine protease Do
VGATRPGTRSTLQVFRRGSSKELGVTVAELEADAKATVPASGSTEKPAKPAPAALAALGLNVSDLSEAQRRELKLKSGVRIDAVDGAAARAGLREGDVILSLANTEVTDVKQLEALVARQDKGRPLNLLFRRGEWAQYAVIRPGR